ncbi:hypothetical protein [Desulfotomaculum sp. 1211_IL3151]|uniref:hypothetical protein n=1 Tax=Desulfotomaculum sp. 1211_IL3151 TaxID=3084055 RepID=UPI002FD8F75C
MLLLLLSIVCAAALKLMQNEKLTLRGSEEELQAYYRAEAAMEKVFSIVKDNAVVIERFTLNKAYGRYELESLQKTLSGKDAASIASLRTIPNLNITKTSASSNVCQLRVEVSAEYYDAKKSLVANIKVGLPLNRFQGIFVQASPDIQNNASLQTPLYILNDVQCQPVGTFGQNIYIKGNCLLQPGTDLTTDTLKILGNVTLASGAQMKGELLAKGDLLINGDILGGPVRSEGHVIVEEGHVGSPLVLEDGNIAWDGDIYAGKTISPETSSQFGQAYANQPQIINHSFLEYPNMDLNWYDKNCDSFYAGDQVLRAEDLTEGIHYIQGNVTLTGLYQGNITLISSGMVTIAAGASLRAANAAKDSLFILAKEKVLVESQAQVDALVYTAGTMQLANQARLAGAVICQEFICHGAAVVSQPILNNIHPTWTTTEIEILSWQEKYPVFPMN